MNTEQEHFRSLLRGYGPITRGESSILGESDVLRVPAWGVDVAIPRDKDQIDPDYKRLYFATQYYGYGVAAGIERGKKLAMEELRKLIGVDAS